MKRNLTNIQLKTLKAVEKLIDKLGYSPTYEEIGHIRGISKKAVMDQVNILIKKGYLTKMPNKVRTIKLVKVK